MANSMNQLTIASMPVGYRPGGLVPGTLSASNISAVRTFGVYADGGLIVFGGNSPLTGNEGLVFSISYPAEA